MGYTPIYEHEQAIALIRVTQFTYAVILAIYCSFTVKVAVCN